VGRPEGEYVKLLWTGGWDSSFRLLQLLLIEQRPVQPIYVIDTGRNSIRHELRSMEAIRAGVLERLPDPSCLAPTLIYLATDFPPTPENVELAACIRRRVPFGTQYTWLTGPAEALGWSGVELCGEAGTTPWEHEIFAGPGVLNDTPESRLFKYWAFPLVETTKEQMRDIAREHGFLDLLIQRWSCFDPLLGRACGRCHPCSIALHDGMDFAPSAAVSARRTARRLRRALAARRRVAAHP
jgi:hypothetical protein